MDRQSVAQMWGTCFAEAVAEIAGDGGGVAAEGPIATYMNRNYRIPADITERLMSYAQKIGAIHRTELADYSVTVEVNEGYSPTTRRNLTIDAGRATDRGDYPVSYATTSNRPTTPAVMFPEATKDTVTSGEAEAAPKTPRKGTDQCEQWYKEHLSRRYENARIIAESPAPERTDYTADPLAARRGEIEAQSQHNYRRYSRKEMQELGCGNSRLSGVRRSYWTEADRIIHWLYHKPARMQEITELYYERGAHSPEEQQTLRAALNDLKEAGKLHHRRRNGKTVAKLAHGVKPRSYNRNDFNNIPEPPEVTGEEEQPQIEQSFEPQVIAEMAGAFSGASYTESWDS